MADKRTDDSWYRKGKIDPNTYGEAWFEVWGKYAYYITVIIKYLTRFVSKNGREDISKAQFYIDKLLEYWDDQEENKIVGK